MRELEGLFHRIYNIENRFENATRSGVVLTNFGVYGNVMKQSLECLIYLRNRHKTKEKTRKTSFFFGEASSII